MISGISNRDLFYHFVETAFIENTPLNLIGSKPVKASNDPGGCTDEPCSEGGDPGDEALSDHHPEGPAASHLPLDRSDSRDTWGIQQAEDQKGHHAAGGEDASESAGGKHLQGGHHALLSQESRHQSRGYSPVSEAQGAE